MPEAKEEMWPFNDRLPPCPECQSPAEVEGQFRDGMGEGKHYKISCACGRTVRGDTRDKAIEKWGIIEATVAPPKPTRASEEAIASAARVKRVFGPGEGTGPLAPNTFARVEVPRAQTANAGDAVKEALRRNCLGPDRPNGMKDDGGKDRFELLPWGALRMVARVMTRAVSGPNAYDEHSWSKVPNARERYSGALQRHYVKRFHDGEKIDPQYGLPHMAHLACCALFLLAFDLSDEKDPK